MLFILIQKFVNILFYLLHHKYSFHISYIYHYSLGWAFKTTHSALCNNRESFFLFLLFVITEVMWISYIETRLKNF